MEAKPLTKERRAEIERKCVGPTVPVLPAVEYVSMIRDLLAAEAYWRLAVKKIDPLANTIAGTKVCMFCESRGGIRTVDHAPDCAWVRANE